MYLDLSGIGTLAAQEFRGHKHTERVQVPIFFKDSGAKDHTLEGMVFGTRVLKYWPSSPGEMSMASPRALRDPCGGIQKVDAP